jgi:hypothetical protein
VSTLVGLGNGLQAAMLLARGRADGVALLTAGDEPALATAARSFWAAALCLPAFICLQLLDMAQLPALPPHPIHDLTLQLLGSVIGWTGFALLALALARGLDRAPRWPYFIALWNWCNVVQLLALIAARVPGLLDLPDMLGETATVVAVGWVLWLEWYATRLTLGITAVQAAGFVLLDTAISTALDVLSAHGAAVS